MQIHDEQDLYCDTAASVILFGARTNTLLLGIKSKHQGNDETGDWQQFLLRCMYST